MRRKGVIIFVLLAALMVVVWYASGPREPRVSVRFLGYTNVASGLHVGMVEISNASPFVVLRHRSPRVVFNAPSAPDAYVPAGWSHLEPGACEQVMTESLASNRLPWRVTVVCQRLGQDDYGITPESRASRVARWLRDHRVSVPEPRPAPQPQFSSAWIEP
jgi:hypothetical protein